MTTRRILVAGQSGQLARCLMDAAGEAKRSLHALGRPALDIADREAIAKAIAKTSPSAIINAAAYTAVDAAEDDADAAFAVNRDGARNVALAAAQAGVPLIHVSTDYVFDGRKPSPYREDDATAPLNVYGRSKREGEEAVLAVHPRACIVRTSWLYSRYGKNFVTTMLNLAETRDHLRIVHDQRGNPTSAHDLARALLAMADAIANDMPPAPGIYHLAGGGETTWLGFARTIFRMGAAQGRKQPQVEPISSEDYGAKALRPANATLDCTKMKQAFGISLPHWEHSLEACLALLARDKERTA